MAKEKDYEFKDLKISSKDNPDIFVLNRANGNDSIAINLVTGEVTTTFKDMGDAARMFWKYVAQAFTPRKDIYTNFHTHVCGDCGGIWVCGCRDYKEKTDEESICSKCCKSY